MSESHALPLLALRGTFFFPEWQKQDLVRWVEPGKVWHALPIDQEHIIIHTQHAVALYAYSAQSPLWEIDCSSRLFALNSLHNLLVLCSGTTLLLWDLRTGYLLHTLAYEPDQPRFEVNCLALSQDGSRLAVGLASDNESIVGLWDTQNGQLIHTLRLEDSLDVITTVAFQPGGSALAAGSFENHVVWLWDLESDCLLNIWDLHPGSSVKDRPYMLTFHPDGGRLFVAYGKGGIRIWDMLIQHEVASPSGKWCPISVAIDSGGRYLAFTHFADQPAVVVLEISNWLLMHTFTGYPPFTYPFFSLDGQWLAITHQHQGCIPVRAVITGQVVREVNLGH